MAVVDVVLGSADDSVDDDPTDDGSVDDSAVVGAADDGVVVVDDASVVGAAVEADSSVEADVDDGATFDESEPSVSRAASSPSEPHDVSNPQSTNVHTRRRATKRPAPRTWSAEAFESGLGGCILLATSTEPEGANPQSPQASIDDGLVPGDEPDAVVNTQQPAERVVGEGIGHLDVEFHAGQGPRLLR